MRLGARGSSQRGVCRQRFVLRAQATNFAALPSIQSSGIVQVHDGVGVCRLTRHSSGRLRRRLIPALDSMNPDAQGKSMFGHFREAIKGARGSLADFRMVINRRVGGQRIPTFRESIPNLAPIALLIWLFAGHEIYQRAAISLDGTVVSSETSCVQPYNNRCDTAYVLEGRDGAQSAYVAGPTDESLERRLPVGTVIHKSKWSLSYTVDARNVNDFPIGFYGGLMAFGLLCALFGRPTAKKQI
jgi:hypothetical protein